MDKILVTYVLTIDSFFLKFSVIFLCFNSLLFEENQTSSFEPIGQVLVSKVLGATLGQPNGSIQFVDGKVEILLSTLNLDLYEVDETSATCVFWDTSTEDWSSDGCEVLVTNGEYPNPLTNQFESVSMFFNLFSRQIGHSMLLQSFDEFCSINGH